MLLVLLNSYSIYMLLINCPKSIHICVNTSNFVLVEMDWCVMLLYQTLASWVHTEVYVLAVRGIGFILRLFGFFFWELLLSVLITWCACVCYLSVCHAYKI